MSSVPDQHLVDRAEGARELPSGLRLASAGLRGELNPPVSRGGSALLRLRTGSGEHRRTSRALATPSTRDRQTVAAGSALIVRLPNWVGNVVQSIPTLEMLQQAGYELHLVGKPWARALLAGYEWPVYARAAGTAGAIAQLWRLRRQLCAADFAFGRRINVALLTGSHRSAMEARFAGLRVLGYARDMRSHWLSRTVPFERGLAPIEEYWRIGAAVLENGSSQHPGRILLKLPTSALEAARALRARECIGANYVMLCPFSGNGQDRDKKRWPEFPRLASALRAQGIPVVLCPGPDEEEEATANYPGATICVSTSLEVYAALLKEAWFTVSNDTGPGHIAAASGGTLFSVFGPHFAACWVPLGPRVTIIHGSAHWPSLQEVIVRLPAQRPS
jgi:heptosyltransferase-2